MICRTNAKKDIEEKSDLIIHDMTNLCHWGENKNDWNRCPFCNTNMDKYSYTIKQFCCPSNRFTEGFLWWKKVCSKEGFHRHFICGNCKMHWIINLDIKDNPIKGVVML